MQEYVTHKPGTFCWLDMATTDIEEAKKFYNEIFGWDAVPSGMEDGSEYTMFNMNGKNVAAMYLLMKEQKDMGIPPHWMSYIACDQVEAILEKVKANGGNVISEIFEIPEVGRGAMIQDPEGAVVGLWQADKHIGMSYKNIPNSLSWVEHASHGNPATIAFLENVFSWTSNTQKFGDTDYTTFFAGEEAVAGLYVMPAEMHSLPCHWLPYFMVANIDETLNKSEKMNGKILMPKMFIAGVGHFAVIQDPQGAVFGAIQSEM